MTAPPCDFSPRPGGGPLTYQVTVAGHLDDHWQQSLGGTNLVRNDDASTTLTFAAADQAQLHGVLAGIRDLGASLQSLYLLGPTPTRQPSPTAVLRRTLRTRRLILRPAHPHDAPATWAYRRLNSVNQWLAGVPADFDQYRRVFLEPERLAATVIVELAEAQDRVIGDFMLRLEDAWSQAEVADHAKNAQAELGWVLHPDCTGHGYATEAVSELLRYSFKELGVHRAVANCFLGNDSSWRLMQRVGMRRESHAVSESLHRSGRWLDTVGYALLASEWKPLYAHPRAPRKERP